MDVLASSSSLTSNQRFPLACTLNRSCPLYPATRPTPSCQTFGLKGGVKIRPVGGSQDYSSLTEAIHLNQQLVQRLFTLVMSAAVLLPVPATSISSMNTMHGAFSWPDRTILTLEAPTPTNISTKSEPLMLAGWLRLKLPSRAGLRCRGSTSNTPDPCKLDEFSEILKIPLF